ncbi:hypothetical protein N9X87_00390, partial [bacterium]|nr:hypothetical protein [bacterium]
MKKLKTNDAVRNGGKRLIGLMVALGVIAIIFIPELQIRQLPKSITAEKIATIEDSYRKTLIQIIGGGVVIFGIYLTWRRISALEKQV